MSLDCVRLGRSELVVPRVGVGTWQWGDRRVWRYDSKAGEREAEAAFRAACDGGLTFFDTAEMYGGGTSERLLGRFAARDPDVVVATKFAPWPWRLRASSLTRALEGSLERLGRRRVDLYQIHFPWTSLRQASLMSRLVDAVSEGKARAVGVSNYSVAAMRRAHDLLGARGVPLATNQVRYSLMHRAPLENGLLAACRELGVTVIAYSPLAMGALTGRFGPGNMPKSIVRRARGPFFRLRAARPLLDALATIGEAHDRSAAQVALNWLAVQSAVVPIPGARTAEQARSNAASITFRLTDEEWQRLDALSRRAF